MDNLTKQAGCPQWNMLKVCGEMASVDNVLQEGCG